MLKEKQQLSLGRMYVKSALPFHYFLRPIAILRHYRPEYLRGDLVAGATVGVVLLPQAIAFALIAGLPPQMGLYTAIVGAIVGGLWGSSHHLHTGPTNTASLLVLSILLPQMAIGSAGYIAAAGLIAIMVGVFRIAVGMARLGILANFVSDSVIVGFTAGAGALIAIGQLPNLLGLTVESSDNVILTLERVAVNLPAAHVMTSALGFATILVLVLGRRLLPRLPGPLVAIVLGAALVAALDLDQVGVRVIGHFPSTLPPLAYLPILDVTLIGQLSSGALALGAIGLVEATSIARSFSAQSGQRLDTNQEFIGQGIANVVSGLLSGYAISGSFNRSAINYNAGARTSMATVISGLFVLLAMLLFSPAAAYIPRAGLAAVLVVIAYGMVDRREMIRIWHSSRGDTIIMLGTLLATLFLPLQFAVLSGILMSLAHYILQTSAPRVIPVLPTADFRHFLHQPEKPECPQLGIVSVLGDFYFGAVNHVEDALRAHMDAQQDQRFLLLRMQNVNQCDISGIHMLESVVRAYRERGGRVYFMKVKLPVYKLMVRTGFSNFVGKDHFLGEEQAIDHLFHHVLDPAVCIYECEIRAFKECQNLPKVLMTDSLPELPLEPQRPVPEVDALQLWQQLHSDGNAPLVVDVREPREFERGHIQQAKLLPMSRLNIEQSTLPRERPLVLVCRSGRRSRRVAYALQAQGFEQLATLAGGMQAWEEAGLLEAVERFG